MKKYILFLLSSMTINFLSAAPVYPAPCPRAKLIDLSWANPSVDYYVKNLKTLEKCAPVDGLVIRFMGTPRMVNGKKFYPGSGTIMGKIAWEYDDFRDAVAKMKQVKSSKFTDNFFYTTVSPGDADWFSDADWKSVVNNYAIAARIARETGMKGLLVDIEEYSQKFWDFHRYKGKYSFPEMRKKARQRGQEWGKAVFAAYPEGTFFFLHFLSCAKHGFSLVVPFLDGMYDVIPPKAVIIDGQETASYEARNMADYDRMFCFAHRTHPVHLSPENRLKHRMQTRFAPALYMDAIFPLNPKFRYYLQLKPEIDRGSLEFLSGNLLNAMDRAEGYIWLYSEKSAWWPNAAHPQVKTTWEQRVPGIAGIVDLIRDPDTFPLNQLKGKNLLQPTRWNFWQEEDNTKKDRRKPGHGTNKNNIQQITGVIKGCYFQNFPVKPGEVYLFRADCRAEKELNGQGNSAVCYMDQKGQWMVERHIFTFNPAQAGQWVTGTLLFVVPENAKTASIQLAACAQRPQDTISFRNAVFIPIIQLKGNANQPKKETKRP